MIEAARKILTEVFGYGAFRPLQLEIIENILGGKDTLAILPTGGGKSLCYQIPGLIFEGLTIVVSPLLSLMKDQVEQLREVGAAVTVLNSTLSPAAYHTNVGLVQSGQIKLLYLAPETLLKERTLSLLSDVPVACLAIDEAHCISEWGHDFRPEYRQLVEIRKRFPKAVCAAFTATATPRVRQDIQDSLGFARGSQFIGSFNRENLVIRVEAKSEPFSQVVDFLKAHPSESGIIYCFSRKQVDQLAEMLLDRGFSVKPYHAGLAEEERKAHQELFIRDDILIMVATIAFGMGIDKPNVRFVIHFDLPKNIETYYQEIGRAGRDGLPAHCLLLFSYADIQKIKYFISQMEEERQRVAHVHLSALLRFAETDVCRRRPLLSYFGETYEAENCGACDNCLSDPKERQDITELARTFLSCIKRTGQIFGTNHIIDVLRGSKSQKVLRAGHDRLEVYGGGQEYSRKQWFHLSRQLIQQGLIAQEMQYGSLKITPKAYDLFRRKQTVWGIIPREEAPPLKERAPKVDKGLPEYDMELFQVLRQKRKALADAAGIPPYVVFPDKTLIEMAAYLPRSPEELLNIHGVGRRKLEKYGAIFLDLIEKQGGLS
jgi:ATP-dependent DNA helicase RecQ